MKTLTLKTASHVCCRVGVLASMAMVPAAAFAAVPGFDAACSAYNQGRLTESQNQIFALLKSDADAYLKPEFVLLLSATYLAAGEPAQAQAVLDALRGEFPLYATDPNAVRIQAGIYEQNGQWEKAQALLGKAPSGDALYHLAVLLDHSGQTFAAVTRLKELIASSPEAALSERAHLALAGAYLRLNENAQAERVLASVPVSEQTKSYVAFLSAAAAFGLGDIERARAQWTSLETAADPTLRGFGAALGGARLMATGDATAAALFDQGLSIGTERSRLLAAVGAAGARLRENAPQKSIDAVNRVLPAMKGADQDRLLLIRGVASQRLGQTGTAMGDFEAVIRRAGGPWRARALALAAHTLWYDNDFTRLATDYSKTLADARAAMSAGGALSPEDAENLNVCDLLVANAHYSLRRYRDAELLYRDILRRAPAKNLSAVAVSGLVASQVFQKKFSDAQKALDELMVRFGEDRDVVRFGLHSQANLNWNQERYAPALEQYRKYVEMFPADERTPYCLYQIGRCHEKLSHPADALTAWTALREKHPSSPYAYNALVRSASAAEAVGNKALAEKLYAETSRSSESAIAENALLSLGRQQLESGRAEQAIETLDQLTVRFPLANNRAAALPMLRDAYQRVALTRPEALDALAVKYAASFHAGEAAYHQGMRAFDKSDYAAAAALFQKTWSSHPGSPSAPAALFYHGESLFRLNDYEGAIASMHQFLLSNPHHDLSILARLRRAKSLDALGQHNEAIKSYRAVIDQAPQSDAAAQATLGLIASLDRVNQFEDETQAAQTFLAQYPDHARANATMWRLAQLQRRAGHYAAASATFRNVRAEPGVATEDEIKQAVFSMDTLAQATGGAKTQ